MGVIKVNYAALEEAAQGLGQARNELAAMLDDFRASSQMLDSTTDGTERTARAATLDRAGRSLDDLGNFLGRLQGNVTQHAANTRDTDAQLARRWA